MLLQVTVTSERGLMDLKCNKFSQNHKPVSRNERLRRTSNSDLANKQQTEQTSESRVYESGLRVQA